MKIGLMTEDRPKGNAIQRNNDFAIPLADPSGSLPDPPPQAGEGTGRSRGKGVDSRLAQDTAQSSECRNIRGHGVLPLPLAGEGWGGGSF